MSINDEFDQVSLAVASSSIQHRKYLEKLIQYIGINIVLNEPLSPSFVDKLIMQKVDVVLLDIDEGTHKHQGVLDKIMDTVDVPVIFNDISALTLTEPKQLEKWYRKLLAKISDLTACAEWQALDLKPVIEQQMVCHVPVDEKAKIELELAKNVWVLGASHGGPEMLKQFLANLNVDVPVAFILAQHMGERFNEILAEQLNRITPFHVLAAKNGHVLHHHEVIVVPARQRLLINPIGAIELTSIEEEMRYLPSIDLVVADMAQRYKQDAGAIIFSGMGDDGVKGALEMIVQGGRVWAQEANSCVASSMPTSVHACGVVTEMGTPDELAEKLIAYYS